MTGPTDADGPALHSEWREELRPLHVSVYAVLAAPPTPLRDRVFRRISAAADHSKLWVAAATVLATLGGEQGRRAAAAGLASVGLTSAVVNLALKPLGGGAPPP